jgi:hypothetical protein
VSVLTQADEEALKDAKGNLMQAKKYLNKVEEDVECLDVDKVGDLRELKNKISFMFHDIQEEVYG